MTTEEALAAQRWETARRLALAALLEPGGDTFARREQLHEALRRLGDLSQAQAVLEGAVPETDAQRLAVPLLRGEDFHLLAENGSYQDSAQARAGLSLEEYRHEMRSRRDAEWAKALQWAKTPEARRQAADVLARCGRGVEAAASPPLETVPAEPALTGRVWGRLRFPGGDPAAGVLVTLGLATLGLAMKTGEQNPETYLSDRMHYVPQIGPQDALTTGTDAEGRFYFPRVPAGRQEFLAVTLDAARHDIPTRFLAQGIEVPPGETVMLDLTAGEWQSALARVVPSPFAPQMERGGVCYLLVHQETWKNPFPFDFPRQAVTFPLPPNAPAERLLLLSSDDPACPLPFQLTETGLLTLIGLPPVTDKTMALYAAQDGAAEAFAVPEGLRLLPDPDGQTAILSTGRAEFRLLWGEGADSLPPLLGVLGVDNVWRGAGRFTLPDGLQITHRQTTVREQGPLQITLEVVYTLSNGQRYTVQWTAHQGEAYLLAKEISPTLDGAAWEFSLREWGANCPSGGRGFLHWTPEGKSVHWTTLAAQDKELARLQESVPWWLPPCGFGYAFTADGLEAQDYVALFTLRRGEWVDRAFAAIASGPGEGERRELDWPFPEMVGSTLSMLTAQTDASGDAFFRFAFFDGERQWGILMSTLARNDGPWKELSEVQHKNSSPRLQDFKDWRLDEPDSVTRPSVVARRQELKALRRKKDAPRFQPLWKKITAGNVPGPAEGLRFAVEGDPRLAWRKKKELVGVAPIRARMTLLGRDFSDMYSPVGARPITPWAEDYDLVAASGVFTPDEERQVRAFLLLMGHMYGETDLMNWRYGSRNANFEADRVDVVGTVGLTFHGNPDADAMARHAAESMERALNVYCTPGSGKWYENPACYYLQASKCRLNLAFHLWAHGLTDPTAIPRLRDFLNWGILLLTPPAPTSYAAWRGGAGDDAALPNYADLPKTRLIPPIGDHAGLGRWLPEHYALAAKMYRVRDPEFADRLLWAWQNANPDAGGPAQSSLEQPGELPNSTDGSDFGAVPLLFAALEEEDLRPAPDHALTSRRLEGFGAVLRGGFGTEHEFYFLWKQGPGGYRYHRTEGSFLLFAGGKPLVYDGGEGGETWRHSTLSFGDTHAPLAAGHVERFHALPEAEFVQGVHPVALKPGEPVYLSDNCHHSLVPVAFTRYAEPNPADVRSALWVKDEYVILHDDLHLDPETVSHWHLQVVADREEGDAERGWRFRGRFGVDLQVALPGQRFESSQVTATTHLERNLPPEQAFTMRHLCVTGGPGTAGYFALLRPLAAGRQPVSAALLHTEGGAACGMSVTSDGLHDRLFLHRAPVQWQEGSARFTGRYGAVLERTAATHLLLLGSGVLEWGGVQMESDGPAASVQIVAGQPVLLMAEGIGTVRVDGPGVSQTVTLSGRTGRKSAKIKAAKSGKNREH